MDDKPIPNPDVLASIRLNDEQIIVYKKDTDAEKVEKLLKIVKFLGKELLKRL